MCLFNMICHMYLLHAWFVSLHAFVCADTLSIHSISDVRMPRRLIHLLSAIWCFKRPSPTVARDDWTRHTLRLLGSENSGKPRKPKSQRCLGDEKWSAWRFSSHVILPCFLGFRVYGFRKQINSGMTFEFPTIRLFWVWQQWFSRADASIAIFLCSKVSKVSAKGSATTSRRKALRFTQRRQSIKQKKKFDVQDGIIRSSEHCWRVKWFEFFLLFVGDGGRLDKNRII